MNCYKPINRNILKNLPLARRPFYVGVGFCTTTQTEMHRKIARRRITGCAGHTIYLHQSGTPHFNASTYRVAIASAAYQLQIHPVMAVARNIAQDNRRLSEPGNNCIDVSIAVQIGKSGSSVQRRSADWVHPTVVVVNLVSAGR